jgi:hypothetical protein
MENYNDYHENYFEDKKRPGFLTFLCILTFIGSGLSLLTNLVAPIFAPILVDAISQSAFSEAAGVYEQMAETPIWQFYLLAFFNAAAILGAVYMLKMKRIGFHIYVTSQLVQMCIGQFIIGGFFKPNFFGLTVTVLFIGLYAIYYKKFTGMETEKIDENINDNE